MSENLRQREIIEKEVIREKSYDCSVNIFSFTALSLSVEDKLLLVEEGG